MAHQPPTKATPLNEAVKDVADTISQGAVPPNAQVVRVLDEAERLVESKKREAPLDSTGKEIAEKIKNVVEAAKETVLEKNQNEEIQKFVCASKQAVQEAKCSDTLGELQDTALEAKDRATYIAIKEGLKTSKDIARLGNAMLHLGYELASSAEFRRLLIELLDMLQEGLQGAQEKLQSGLERAKENVQSAKSELESGKSNKEIAKDAAEAGGKKVGELLGDAAKTAIDVGDAARAQLGEAGETLGAVARGEKPPSALLPLSEEQKERFRARFNELLDRIASTPAYADATRQLFAMAEQLRAVWAETVERTKAVAEHAKAEVQQSCAVQEAYDNAVAFFRRFVPEAQFDCFLNDLRALSELVTNDPRLSLWWMDLRDYVRFALDHPREAVSVERTAQLNSLIDRAFEYSLDLRYNRLTRRVNREARALVETMRNELQHSRLVTSLRELAATLFLDSKGNVQWKENEIRQFRILMASLLLEELKFIPVPKLEGSTDEYSFRLEQLHLYMHDMLPEHISVEWRLRADLNLKSVEGRARSLLSIRVTNMKAHIRNAAFWFRKKTGLVKMEDHGIADVSIRGAGASMQIDLWADTSRPQGVLELHRVALDLSSLSIHLVESEHKVLLTLVKPFWENSVRRSIEREVEYRIASTLRQVFENLHQVAAKVSEKASLEKVGEIARETVLDIQAAKSSLTKQDNTAIAQ